jgi:hypothetical protein
MREMIDWIGAEAERVEESGVVRRRGRFTHEGIGELPAHSFPGRGSELTTEGTEGKGERESSSTWTGARAGCRRYGSSGGRTKASAPTQTLE